MRWQTTAGSTAAVENVLLEFVDQFSALGIIGFYNDLIVDFLVSRIGNAIIGVAKGAGP